MSKILPSRNSFFYSSFQNFTLILFFFTQLGFSQEEENSWKNHYISSEVLFGKTAPSNEFFPSASLHTGLSLGLGKKHLKSKSEWAYRLNYPKTGIRLGIKDMGNRDVLGYQFSILPYVEMPLFPKKKNPLSLRVGLGTSYFNKKFDEENNSLNHAVSTNFSWAFDLFFYYPILQSPTTNLRLGLGFSHQSNGHKKLPNNGYNSFLGSLNANFNFHKEERPSKILTHPSFKSSQNYYLMLETGWGENSLSLSFNQPKNVYALRLGVGKKINNTYRIGVGVFYHFYRHYYDYIRNNESLVQGEEEFESLKNHPALNASAFGVFITGEVILLNHIGLFAQIGVNLHKPSYGIDWRINEGWQDTPQEIPEGWVLGEYNSKYKIKKLISTRLGAKYYFTGVDTNPVHNFYLFASNNANLGQADFNEFGLGYIYNFKG
ncbi:acyloxyacyl hydrolase [Mesonia ostreae]|uniref:Acyloxyacyl hydrolase n=1 Tax=Mesonia ostreae TaxID=861110 RepID=A0ABU2KM90_9FLAO|nr:acyloxyacyl hydrolase [Mesonia ostreae]MDT0295819.1 acyloxyacyl hydrolase [Mesonia ostreae]